MTPIECVLRLALLLNAASEPATPSPDTLRCRLAGHVFIVDRDMAPAAFANVIVLGTKKGALSDETGAYVVDGLPPGMFQVKIQSVGRDPLVEVVTLVAGQTTHRDFGFEKSRYAVARDSLIALGQWPPSLDPGLLEHMRSASDVRVFRLEPDRPALVGLEPSFKRWPIIGEAPQPKHHEIEKLIEAMHASAYRLGLRGEPQKLCGGFSPGIDVRFTRDGVPVDVLLCYRCYELSIFRNGQFVQSADFSDARFVAFAKHSFAHDPVLNHLGEPAQQPHH